MIYIQMPESTKVLDKIPGKILGQLIMQKVATYSRVSPNLLKCRRGPHRDVYWRHICWFLINKYTLITQAEIAELFCNSERTNIHYGIKKIRNLMDVYPEVKQDINNLSIDIKGILSIINNNNTKN